MVERLKNINKEIMSLSWHYPAKSISQWTPSAISGNSCYHNIWLKLGS